jgi:hypothetical protein
MKSTPSQSAAPIDAAPRTIDELERRAAIVDAATRRAHELRDRMLDELVSGAWQRIGDGVARLLDHAEPRVPRAPRLHGEG